MKQCRTEQKSQLRFLRSLPLFYEPFLKTNHVTSRPDEATFRGIVKRQVKRFGLTIGLIFFIYGGSSLPIH